MHYEDQGSQINLLAGLSTGALLGVGLVLLLGRFGLRRRSSPRLLARWR